MAACKPHGEPLFRSSSWQHPYVVGSTDISGSSHQLVTLSKHANYRECCKSCYSGNCCCSKSKTSRSGSLQGTNIFLWCVCSSPRAAGQFLGVLNTYCLEMPFSFPQCKPCWKNETPLCLEVRLKYLFGCLQLLSAFRNWRLIEHRYWWAKKWVGHKTGPVANQAQMEHGLQKGCAYNCESATQCQDSQSQKDFRWWGTSWVMFSSTYYGGWKQFGFVDLCSAKQTSICYTALWNTVWAAPGSNAMVLPVTDCAQPLCLINVSVLARYS